LSSAIQIRMGGYGPESTGFSRALKLIGNEITSALGDAVDIKYVWNIMDLGYRAEDILWLVEHGLLTLGYQSSSYLTARVPELGIADLPFLFASTQAARAAMDGALGGALAGAIEARTGFRILGWFENGFRHISNRLRPVRRPADLAGMRIRVLPSKVQARTFELLGAVPMPMDLTEAIAMIKAGEIDAQENPLSNTVTYGVHRFHRFHSLTNHFYISRPVFIHRAAFDAWPGDVQAAMRSAVARRNSMPSLQPASRRCGMKWRAPSERSCSGSLPWAEKRLAQCRCGVARSQRAACKCALPARLARRCQNERPEHLVLGFGRVGCRNAHAGCAIEQHVGAVLGRIPPAGERLGEGVVAGTDVLGCRPRAITVRLETLAEAACDIVVERVAACHRLRLRLCKLHQIGVDADRRKAVIGAVARDH